MNDVTAPDMTCSVCGHTGGFLRAKPRFLVFGTWHWLVERNTARRTLVCPQCGTKLTLAAGKWAPHILMAFMIVVALVGAWLIAVFVVHPGSLWGG